MAAAEEIYPLGRAGRVRFARLPLLAGGLGAGVAWVFFSFDSWTFWVVLGFSVLLVVRSLWVIGDGGKAWSALRLSDGFVARDRSRCELAGAAVTLFTRPKNDGFEVVDVLVQSPDGRRSVVFGNAHERFPAALKSLLTRVPWNSVTVHLPGEADVQGEIREKLLRPYAPSPVDRVLQELGKGALQVPPHLRN